MPEALPPPVFLAGMPRSGTTWAATVLAAGTGLPMVHEPDNEKLNPAALLAKRGLHRFPELGPGDRDDAYARLWDTAVFHHAPGTLRLRGAHIVGWVPGRRVEADVAARCAPGGKGLLGAPTVARLRAAAALLARTGRRTASDPPPVVKTVHGILALPWLAARYQARVVLLRRAPLAVAASLLRLGMNDGDRNLVAVGSPDRRTRVERAADQVLFFEDRLAALAHAHPGWAVVRHEDLSAAPHTEFPRLAKRLGFSWSQAGDQAIAAADREGQGFQPQRSAAQRAAGPGLDAVTRTALEKRLARPGGSPWPTA